MAQAEDRSRESPCHAPPIVVLKLIPLPLPLRCMPGLDAFAATSLPMHSRSQRPIRLWRSASGG